MQQPAQVAVDLRLEQIAATLGASRLRIFFVITIPLAYKGIVAGALLAFSRALGEFGATILLAGNIPDDARQALRRKLTGTLHTISEHLLDQGHYWRAWEYHLKSLFYPGGLAFLPYTRRLLLPARR